MRTGIDVWPLIPLIPILLLLLSFHLPIPLIHITSHFLFLFHFHFLFFLSFIGVMCIVNHLRYSHSHRPIGRRRRRDRHG